LTSIKKLNHLIFYSGISGFDIFRGGSRQELKLKDSKIQGVLRYEKTLRGIKEARWKKSKPKA
jgi:hypothetical protein